MDYIVVLPIEGSPYIHGKATDDEDFCKTMRELVGGPIEHTPRGYYTIHPMFSQSNERWNIARQLLNCKQVISYGHYRGMYECDPNYAVIITPEYRSEGCPIHSWGNEILIVPENVLKLLQVDIDNFKTKLEDEEEEEE